MLVTELTLPATRLPATGPIIWTGYQPPPLRQKTRMPFPFKASLGMVRGGTFPMRLSLPSSALGLQCHPAARSAMAESIFGSPRYKSKRAQYNSKIRSNLRLDLHPAGGVGPILTTGEKSHGILHVVVNVTIRL